MCVGGGKLYSAGSDQAIISWNLENLTLHKKIEVCCTVISLQNRRNFLRISGEQRRKRGEPKARVVCEGRSNSSFTPATRSPCFRLCSPEIHKKLHLFCRLYRYSKQLSLASQMQLSFTWKIFLVSSECPWQYYMCYSLQWKVPFHLFSFMH